MYGENQSPGSFLGAFCACFIAGVVFTVGSQQYIKYVEKSTEKKVNTPKPSGDADKT